MYINIEDYLLEDSNKQSSTYHLENLTHENLIFLFWMKWKEKHEIYASVEKKNIVCMRKGKTIKNWRKLTGENRSSVMSRENELEENKVTFIVVFFKILIFFKIPAHLLILLSFKAFVLMKKLKSDVSWDDLFLLFSIWFLD